MNVITKSPIDDRQETQIDDGLKRLRIDRSRTAGRHARGKLLRMLLGLCLLILLISGWLFYRQLSAATAVETVRVQARSTSSSGEIPGALILNVHGYIVGEHKMDLTSKISG